MKMKSGGRMRAHIYSVLSHDVQKLEGDIHATKFIFIF